MHSTSTSDLQDASHVFDVIMLQCRNGDWTGLLMHHVNKAVEIQLPWKGDLLNIKQSKFQWLQALMKHMMEIKAPFHVQWPLCPEADSDAQRERSQT